MSRQATIPVLDEIWGLIRETQKNIKEVSAGQKELQAGNKELQTSQKETDKQIKELRASQKETSQHIAELRASQKELQASQKETSQYIKEVSAELRASQKQLQASQKETSQHIAELRASQKETDKQLKAVIGDFGNRWGKLGENLVKGSLVQRLKERGIEVERVITNAKNKSSEFDIIAINGKETVVVEVKATLDPSDVNEFTEDIKRFTKLWPEFKDKTIYGAMAFLIKANRQACQIAQNRGFFVIEATGDVIIQNKKDFQPQVF